MSFKIRGCTGQVILVILILLLRQVVKTSWPIGQAVKTPVFHTGIQGSTP